MAHRSRASVQPWPAAFITLVLLILAAVLSPPAAAAPKVPPALNANVTYHWTSSGSGTVVHPDANLTITWRSDITYKLKNVLLKLQQTDDFSTGYYSEEFQAEVSGTIDEVITDHIRGCTSQNYITVGFDPAGENTSRASVTVNGPLAAGDTCGLYAFFSFWIQQRGTASGIDCRGQRFENRKWYVPPAFVPSRDALAGARKAVVEARGRDRGRGAAALLRW